jgi:hypothetical protein
MSRGISRNRRAWWRSTELGFVEGSAERAGSSWPFCMIECERHWEKRSAELAQRPRRDERWSEAIAVGGKEFIERVQRQLGLAATHRKIEASVELHALREEGAAYEGNSRTQKGVLSVDNSHFWKEKISTT